MTDLKKENENTAPQFKIQRIYLKDISFETPNVPEIFTKEWKPEFNLDINSSPKKLSDDVYDVALRITLTAKSDGDVAYICEVTQSGIFTTQGIDGINLEHCLNAFCPNILFPYARETISSIINKGTFLPFNLEPVNFDLLFNEYLKEKGTVAEGSTNLQ